MIYTIINYSPLIILGIGVVLLSYVYTHKTHIDDVPKPDDDCPFWTGDPP